MWTHEWPTQPGFYWFYGWTSAFSKREGETKKVRFVEVRAGRPPSLFFITEGNFFYRNDARGNQDAEGLWQPAVLPTPPC